MNILAIKLENVENLVSSHFTGKWRRCTLVDQFIDFRDCLWGEKSGSLCLCGFYTLWVRRLWVGSTSATCVWCCWNGSVVDTLGGRSRLHPSSSQWGFSSAPHGAFLHFLTVVVNVRVCKCLWNSLYTCSCKYNFAMVTPVFTSCGPFKKSLFTCATLLLSFWRKYHESHTSCSSPLTQTGWRGTFFMKYDCERVIGWTFWGNSHK